MTQPFYRQPFQERPIMDKKSVYILLLAAGRYASSRSKEDRAVMFSVGRDFWKDFPAFLMEMKEAIQAGRSRDFLNQGDIKHMYALLFMSIMNGLDTDHLNRVGGALFAAASPRKAAPSRKTSGAGHGTRALAAR